MAISDTTSTAATFARKNRLINGSFTAWQRGPSNPTATDNAYGPDRWRSVYYYKGKGRVVFKGDGGFSSGSQVLYLEYDPTEPG